MDKSKRNGPALPHTTEFQIRKILICIGETEPSVKPKAKLRVSFRGMINRNSLIQTIVKLREFYRCAPQDKANKPLHNLFINVGMTVNFGLSDLLSQIFPDISKRVRSNLN